MPFSTRRYRWLASVLLLLVIASPARAQQKLLSIDDIYDQARHVNFSGNPPSGLTWIDATHFAWPRAEGTPGAEVEWVRVDAVSGSTQPLFDAARMETALAKLPGVSHAEARRAARSRTLVFDDKYSAAVASLDDDLYAYVFNDDRVLRLTYQPGLEEHPSFSPDGRLVSFLRGANLFVVDVAGARETPLTTDGRDKRTNGRLDWVYEEEIYGRGQKTAYWWSPDSSRIAFLQLDDAPVPVFTVVDHIPYDPAVEHWNYPKAGDPNPRARLGVVAVTGARLTWMDTERYSGGDHLIVAVGWTPDSQKVAFQVQNRTQTWLALDLADAATGSARTVLRDTTKTWVNPPEDAKPVWLKDGSFLWQSERSGWKHLYHYRPDGTLVRQVTDGTWEMRTLHGLDEAGGWIYFSGTEHSPIGGDVYRIKLDGSGLQRLSRTEGTHTAVFSPDLAYYIDTWSDATTPSQVRLHKSDGSEVRVIAENTVAQIAEYKLSKPEFLRVKTRDGFVMEAMMIKPPGFNPSRRYPVYQFTYGGPHNPQVKNAWGGAQYMYHQLLAQKGVIVWICDNRTASGKGGESSWLLGKEGFGASELRDIEDGLAWLKQQPWVDGSRIGIHGWSYGGFMTSYALTHSKSFAFGIAGGTVSDWRDYDSVYTERYLGLPQENPEGYRKSSPRWAAGDLQGDLLLIHGSIDDNVHMQNTMQFVYELQKAQKPFQLMLYPKSRHGVVDPALVKHMRTMMLDYTLARLKPAA